MHAIFNLVDEQGIMHEINGVVYKLIYYDYWMFKVLTKLKITTTVVHFCFAYVGQKSKWSTEQKVTVFDVVNWMFQ